MTAVPLLASSVAGKSWNILWKNIAKAKKHLRRQKHIPWKKNTPSPPERSYPPRFSNDAGFISQDRAEVTLALSVPIIEISRRLGYSNVAHTLIYMDMLFQIMRITWLVRSPSFMRYLRT